MSLTSYNAQDSHPYQKFTWPQMSMALRQTHPTCEAQLSPLSQSVFNQSANPVSLTHKISPESDHFHRFHPIRNHTGSYLMK